MLTRRNILKSLIILPIAITTYCHRTPKLQKIPKNTPILALGDSLTFGYGADKGQTYPDILASLTGWQITNAGVNGDTTEHILQRLDKVTTKQYQLVLLGVGGNDVLRRIPKEITEQNLQKIVERLQTKGMAVVLIAQPHFSASALFGKASDNPVYEKVAKITNVPLFADGWSAILSDKTLKSDQIHANNAGYEKFAQMLYTFLQEIGYA